jgi:hypothetical protein
MNEIIEITFGEPENGWLPVQIQSIGFNLEFEASDAINDPIGELCNALIDLKNDVSPEQILWFLEPSAYFFDFERKDEMYELTISETDELNDNSTERRILKKITGSEEQIINPIKDAIFNFSGETFDEIDWPYRLEENMLQELQ